MLTDIQRGLILQSKVFIKEVLLEKLNQSLNCYFGNVLNLLKCQQLTLVYSLDTSSASMSVCITGEFVQSSPLQMSQGDVHSSPFLRHVHFMVIHPDSQSQRNISINLDGAGGRSVVTGNSCPSLSFQPSGSKLVFPFS